MKLNEKETLQLAQIGRATMHRKIAAGLLPAPERPDGWHVAWDDDTVIAWRKHEDVVTELSEAKRLRNDDQSAVVLHRRIAELLELAGEVRHA